MLEYIHDGKIVSNDMLLKVYNGCESECTDIWNDINRKVKNYTNL